MAITPSGEAASCRGKLGADGRPPAHVVRSSVARTNPDEFLPLTQTTYYVLASLMDRPKHGYAILKDVEWRSQDTVHLGIGNLYTTLKRLLGQGLVERHTDEGVCGEQRKTYRVTGLGATVFREEFRRLRQMIGASPMLGADWRERLA